MHGELPKQAVATRSRTPRYIAFALVLLAVAGALYYVYGTDSAPQQRRARFAGNEGPVPVLVAQAVHADVPVYLNAVGTSRALNTVTVRPQVNGKLLQVNFKEGQDVKKGDILARIDPTTYQATLDQAVAKKAQNQALLGNARSDLERYERLAATNAINKQQADTQRALVAQYAAQVQSDDAAIESAQATLGYTNIVAPLDGRTGIRQVDEGNIVNASDTTGIVTITQIRPIAVLFNLPQQDLPQVITAFAKGPLAADAMRSDTNEIIDRGTLVVVDNQVDSSTGTVKLKAEFPNTNLQLWPGQFVNVRLLVNTLSQATMIPTGAVQRGPTGTYVYVLKDDGTVAMRPIKVQKQDETQTVVASGVTPPERVVTTGFARLTDGAKVTVGGGAPAAGGAPGARQRGGQGGERRQREGGGGAAPSAPR